MKLSLCLSVGLVLTAASAGPSTAALPQVLMSRGAVDQSVLIGEMLLAHNAERHRSGAAPLAWDPALADGARVYANQLARLDLIRHSPKAMRPGIGENLWMGTRGYFSLGAMVASWASERSMFRPALFPNVSTTGNWADVGHYTQMIWPTTSRLGCAVSRSVRSDILVCRYWPSGNVTGRPVP